ncbi:hypothetical protein Y032_0051g2116 [Ancylostoma ceylanicum]|nr:hypothetical protein Y032_0051g2116 [Ancylostoma ceylanicum]
MDGLMQLLIILIMEMDEEKEITMGRGLEDGRYRLQQNHKSHALAIKKYSNKQENVEIVGVGLWNVRDSSGTYKVQEQFYRCDERFNNQCRRKDCEACPHSFTCTRIFDVKSGISCARCLLFAASGRRSAV